jgi:hypothetical protein
MADHPFNPLQKWVRFGRLSTVAGCRPPIQKNAGDRDPAGVEVDI